MKLLVVFVATKPSSVRERTVRSASLQIRSCDEIGSVRGRVRPHETRRRRRHRRHKSVRLVVRQTTESSPLRRESVQLLVRLLLANDELKQSDIKLKSIIILLFLG